MHRARSIVGLLAVAFCPCALAIDASSLEGWWGGVDIGYASVGRHYSVTGDASQHKMMTALRAGYSWDPRLLLGVEAANWLLKGANVWHPNEGAAVQTLSLVAQVYPLRRPLWLKAGFGGARYWTEVQDESGGKGFGGVLGLGYDAPLWEGIRFTPSIDLAWGRIRDATSPAGVRQDQSYRAVAFKIGLTFR